MLEATEPCTSKAARFNTLSSNAADNDVEMEELEDNQDSSSGTLWCIEDDSMFYAQGLKHHSAGKGKSVYVTWNENYLLNFVFKTSQKTGATTLTKVRISLPEHKQELEEIANMLILEMNTLLCMKSGRVYYFSSVKSMHKVDWLTGVRCMSPCPATRFSVIRSLKQDNDEEHRLLSLEVFKDVPQLGKCSSAEQVLCHTYDISFDLENLFNCDWQQETYTLTSLITDEQNIEFLKQLVSIGNIFRAEEDVIELVMHQEVHIFTISANLFLLAGALITESETLDGNSQVEDFGIRLLNTYACPIECIRLDCEKNLLIVVLQSGHMDVWYKSQLMFGAIYHRQHQVTQFLDYDYWPAQNIFYFTTYEEVIQLKIITAPQLAKEQECCIKETRKYIAGMIACTWVESLQQLICLSFNNIFYRLHFNSPNPETLEYSTNANESNYENLNNLYALNSKRVKELTAKAQIVNDLIEKPKQLHNGIEKEFEKQQLLALSTKSNIFQKLFQSHLEYHVNIPALNYFDEDCITIRTANQQHSQEENPPIYSLIFLSLKNKHKFLSSIFTTTIWYLNITSAQQSLQLHLPFELINKSLCFILETPCNQLDKSVLTNYSLNLLCFINHQSQHMGLKFQISLETNEKTYLNLFSYNIKNLPIYRNFLQDIENLLKEQSNNNSNIVVKEVPENVYKLKHFFKISQNVLQGIMEKLKAPWKSLDVVDFKLYYLHQYLIELNYNVSQEILQISSNYPVAIFYIKILLLRAEQQQQQSNNDLIIVDTSLTQMQQMIVSYQNDIEQLYGSLITLESSEEMNSNTITMHLENLQNIYAKIRQEFYDVFR